MIKLFLMCRAKWKFYEMYTKSKFMPEGQKYSRNVHCDNMSRSHEPTVWPEAGHQWLYQHQEPIKRRVAVPDQRVAVCELANAVCGVLIRSFEVIGYFCIYPLWVRPTYLQCKLYGSVNMLFGNLRVARSWLFTDIYWAVCVLLYRVGNLLCR